MIAEPAEFPKELFHPYNNKKFDIYGRIVAIVFCVIGVSMAVQTPDKRAAVLGSIFAVFVAAAMVVSWEIFQYAFRRRRTYIWQHGRPTMAKITKRTVGQLAGRVTFTVPYRMWASYEIDGQTYYEWSHAAPKQYTACPVGAVVLIKVHPTKPRHWVLDLGREA